MKKIFLGGMVLGFFSMAMSSCNKAIDVVMPSNNQKVLGLVVQTASPNATGLILLKDGRAISPQSGFNPTVVRPGNKFVLSFEQISTTGKVINAKVTSFTAASDSTFVPPAVTSDSVAFKSAMQGTHACVFTSAVVVDPSHPGDTTKVIRDFYLTVQGNTFEGMSSYAPVPAGNGIFYFKDGRADNLYFISNYIGSTATFPPGFKLNGHYNYAVFDKYVTIWIYANNTYSGFLVRL